MASGTLTGTTSNRYITVRVTWSSTPNESANTSTVTATLQARKSSDSSDSTSVTATWYLVVGGQSTSTHKKVSVSPNNTWVTIMNATKTIAHDVDGTKSITISASSKADTTDSSWQSTNLSGTVALDNIPRETPATFAVDSAYFGNTIQINLNRADSEFYHTLAYSWNGTTTTIAENVGTSYTWTIPLNLITAIPNAGQAGLNFVVTTYRANGSVVGTRTTTLTCFVPDSAGPVISSIAVTDTGTAIPESWNVFASGKSILHVNASASGQYGATLAAYKIESGNQVAYANDSDIGTITTSGNIDIKVTVTDSRGISTSRTFTQALEVYDYSNPQIENLSIVRANANGTPVDNGTYASISMTCSVSYLGANHNTMTVRVKYRLSTSQSGVWTLAQEFTPSSPYSTATPLLIPNINKSQTYDFRIEVEDYFHLSYVEMQLAAEGAIISWMDGGIGIAFGKSAELRDTADFAWKIHGWAGAELDVPLGVASGGTGGATAAAARSALGALGTNDTWDVSHLTATNQSANNFVALLQTSLRDMIYPVGHILITADTGDYSSFLGGTWEQITGRFLLASGGSIGASAGSTGGAASGSYELSVGNHSHSIQGTSKYYANSASSSASGRLMTSTDSKGAFSRTITIPTIPPYLAVNVWQRTA